MLREMAEKALVSRMDASKCVDCDAGEVPARGARGEGLWSGAASAGRAGGLLTAAETFSLAMCAGRVWCGGWDGTIRIWKRGSSGRRRRRVGQESGGTGGW